MLLTQQPAILVESNERSEYSYIDLAGFVIVFFKEKVSNFVHAQF